MRGFVLLVLLVAMCGGAACADIDYVRINPIAEIRGVWIDAGAIPKTAHGIREMVQSYHKANFNLLLPETICRGYAIYPSGIIQRDPRFAGAIDPLPVMITEAHRLRMEVHPWVWVFRVGYARDKGAVLRAHLDWAELDRDGNDLSPNGGYWINPTNPAARDFVASLFSELTERYDIDGLHLDYIRYETEEKKPFGYSPQSKELFESQYGVNPADVQPGTMDQLFWNKFRERQVNTFVQRISLQTKAIRPNAMISAAVAPYPPDARALYMQNWPNWVENKWVDFVATMSYSNDDSYFARLITRQIEAVGNNTILAEGIGVYMQKDTAQTCAQVGISRQEGAFGQVMFSASYLRSKQLDALRCSAYATKACLPFRDPYSASYALANYGIALRAKGCAELADYYSSSAAALADYAAYHEHMTFYIAPTLPHFAP